MGCRTTPDPLLPDSRPLIARPLDPLLPTPYCSCDPLLLPRPLIAPDPLSLARHRRDSHLRLAVRRALLRRQGEAGQPTQRNLAGNDRPCGDRLEPARARTG